MYSDQTQKEVLFSQKASDGLTDEKLAYAGIKMDETKGFQVASTKNNSCDVEVFVKITDNAGNAITQSKKYDIDITPPEITITYDNNKATNKSYFNKERTATIRIKEREHHFDGAQVIDGIKITGHNNKNKQLSGIKKSEMISGWTLEKGNSLDESVFTTEIKYTKDANYQFVFYDTKQEEKTLPVIGEKEPEPEPVKKTFHLQWIVLLLMPVVVIAIIVVLIIVIKRHNSKKDKTAVKDEPVMVEYTYSELLIPPKAYIILRCNDLPEQIYKAPINDIIYIGRKDADIILDDHYVSSKHCEIILRGELLYVKDCNSSNGTFYENIRIYEETPIISGGNLKIGQYTYNIKLEKSDSK